MKNDYQTTWTMDDERHYVKGLGSWVSDKETRGDVRTMRLLKNYINRGGMASDYARERLMEMERA